MLWTDAETHTRTLRHRHAHSRTVCTVLPPPHTLNTHRFMHIMATRASESGTACFIVRFPYPRSHSQNFTNTLYKSTRANTHAVPLELSHTRIHTRLNVNIVDKPSLKLSLHILRWPFWQTDDEE